MPDFYLKSGGDFPLRIHTKRHTRVELAGIQVGSPVASMTCLLERAFTIPASARCRHPVAENQRDAVVLKTHSRRQVL